MTDGRNKFSAARCSPLPSDVALYQFSIAAGKISKDPIFSRPQKKEVIAKLHPVQASQSVYLEKAIGDDFCAYAIQNWGLFFHPANSSAQVVSEQWKRGELPDGYGLFGLPTYLSVGSAEQSLPGAIWNPSDNLFFEKAVHSAEIFVAGNATEYGVYQKSILDVAVYLYFIGKDDPSSLLFDNPWEGEISDHFKNVPSTDYFRASLAMSRFNAWLKMHDPELLEKAEDRICFDPGENAFPGDSVAKKFRIYAYYEGDKDRISFLPKIIEMIDKGDYKSAAGILSHEIGHRENRRRRKILPDDQIFSQAFPLALDYLSDNSPVWLGLRHTWGDAALLELMWRSVGQISISEELHALNHYELPYYDKIDPNHFDLSLHPLRNEANQLMKSYLDTDQNSLPDSFLKMSLLYALRIY